MFTPSSPYSQICNKCFKESRTPKWCKKCGVRVNGKMKIKVRKNATYNFCTDCFDELQHLDMKQIREILRKTKSI